MSIPWGSVVERSLNGQGITREEALSILRLPDEHLPKALSAAYEVRRTRFGNRVKICVLQNARSGLCPEDCHYCSQSSLSKAEIDKYPLMHSSLMLEGAYRAMEAKAVRYCIVTSGRGPSDEDIRHLCETVSMIKKSLSLEICVSLGILSESQARRLKEAGVGWINHNLNTSKRFYRRICTTHTYEHRVRTVDNIRKAGLMTCCGGIVGMGEEEEDIIDLAFALRQRKVDAIPVNFLHPIKGTPLESHRLLGPARCLKVLCVFRFLNPHSEIRAAGGRELNLGGMQALALYPANSIFVEGYLTTPGQKAEEARRMIESLGFEVECGGGEKLTV